MKNQPLLLPVQTMKRRIRLPHRLLFHFTLIALLSVLFCRAAQPTVFPGADWAEAAPESQGVDSAKLNEAAQLLARTVGADGARELVVVRHGRMIWKGDDIDKRHGVWSATKSFTSTVLGLLIADGNARSTRAWRTCCRS